MSRRTLEELAADARRFVDEHCIPHEETAELNGGKLPQETVAGIARAAREAGLVGLDHEPEHGGQGMGLLEQVVVHEAFGRNTNGIWWHIPSVANVLAHGTPDQIERYLRPAFAASAVSATRSPRPTRAPMPRASPAPRGAAATAG